MKTLNFYPFYAELIRYCQKTTTIRLGDKTDNFNIGDTVQLTVGWNEQKKLPLWKARITHVFCKKIYELTPFDFFGESPDCQTEAAIPYVLSSIYHTVVTDTDKVTVIKWKYLPERRVETFKKAKR